MLAMSQRDLPTSLTRTRSNFTMHSSIVDSFESTKFLLGFLSGSNFNALLEDGIQNWS